MNRWSDFVSKYAAGRNYSVPLLNSAPVAYETQRESIARNAILSQVNTVPEVTPEQALGYVCASGSRRSVLGRKAAISFKHGVA